MESVNVFDSEFELMNMIWDNNPIRIRELIEKAEQERRWKRTTVYTMIKRLSNRGVVKYEDRFVTALFCRQDIQLMKISEFIRKYYMDDVDRFVQDINMTFKLSGEEPRKKDVQKVSSYIGTGG